VIAANIVALAVGNGERTRAESRADVGDDVEEEGPRAVFV
jgi:hypothetical protein